MGAWGHAPWDSDSSSDWYRELFEAEKVSGTDLAIWVLSSVFLWCVGSIQCRVVGLSFSPKPNRQKEHLEKSISAFVRAP